VATAIQRTRVPVAQINFGDGKIEKPKISSPKTLPRWRITISPKRAQELGETDAADEARAIRQAARAFEVRDADIPGLAAQRVR
jgi:hypothetical protein